MEVMTNAGEMALTRILSEANALDILLVRLVRAAFVMPYCGATASGCTPDSDAMWMMRPHFCFCMDGMNTRLTRTADMTLTSNTRCQSSSLRSMNGAKVPGTPTLLIRTWTVPKASRVLS